MNIYVAGINAQVQLISLFVVVGDRYLLMSWMPGKYPRKARIEKIVRGKALKRDEFSAIAEAVPVAMAEQFKGKTITQWLELVGTSYQVDAELAALVEGFMESAK